MHVGDGGRMRTDMLYAKTMQCGACGATVSVDAKRCPQCGGVVVGPMLALGFVCSLAWLLVAAVYFLCAMKHGGAAFCMVLFCILPATVLGIATAYVIRAAARAKVKTS